MAERSAIEWTDATFNGWMGCTKVSPGCDHCYAEARMDTRLHVVGWGAGQPRKRTSVANWRLPLKWNATPFFECPDCGWRGDGQANDTLRGCPTCGAEPRPTRRRVFCSSLADVFDNEVPVQWRVDLLRLIADTPNLDWLLLTKRIGNAHRMMVEAFRAGWPEHEAMWERWSELFRNVWLGATIVNQEEADRDIPKLLATPAAVRFLSMEPLLGPVDLTNIRVPLVGDSYTEGNVLVHKDSLDRGRPRPAIDWVIVGGESGPHARPMHPDWARSLRDQCAATGVPFLFKQWGEYLCKSIDPATDHAPHICGLDLRGRDWGLSKPRDSGWWALAPDAATWSEVDELPAAVVELFRPGKKAAGRLLDGVEHNGFPKVAA